MLLPAQTPLEKINEEILAARSQLDVLLARTHLLAFTKFTKPNYKINWHHGVTCQYLDKFIRGEIKRLMIFQPPRHGKLISASTPILTSRGWTTHGNLKIGSIIFHPSGRKVRVLAKSRPARANVKIHFSDGTIIHCHSNHEWTVFDRSCSKWITVETNYFLKKTKFGNFIKILSGKRSKFQLPFVEPLQFNEKSLPMHPYVLGAWLGDGSCGRPSITHSSEDQGYIDKIVSLGYPVSSVNVHASTGVHTSNFGNNSTRLSKFSSELKKLGILKNKRIPEIYKISSIQQRLELMAGLIDTDGNTDKNSRVRIVTAEKCLAEDILEISRSLGWRGYITEQDPVLSSSGIQGKKIVYTVGFQPCCEIPVALERKKILRFAPKRRIGITKVEILEEGEIGHCIQVSSSDGLYLVGKTMIPTHNSELVSRRAPAFIFGLKPWAKIIATSYVAQLARRMNRDVQRIIDAPEYRILFPHVWLQSDALPQEVVTDIDSTRTNDIFEIVKYGGRYLCAGVGGSVTGEGGDYIFIDDPIKNQEEADSPVYRDKVFEWYDSTLSTRLDDANTGGICLTVTRWHEDDLAGRLLHLAENSPDADKWVVLNLPALREALLATHYPCAEDTREEGEALWPERISKEKLLARKATSLRTFTALFQQRPTALEGGVIKKSWLRFYTRETLPPINEFSRIVQSWDLSFKDANTSDFVVGQVWGVCKGKIYLLDQVRERMGFADSCRSITILSARYPDAMRKLIEEKANGAAVIETLKRSGVMGVIAINPKESKFARLQAVSTQFEAGDVYFPDPSIAPWINTNVDEILTFPNAIHDDTVDATSQALNDLAKAVDLVPRITVL